MRLIDADKLKKAVINNFDNLQPIFPKVFIMEIDNAPTVDKDRYSEGYAQGYVDGHTNASSVSGTWIYKEYSYYCSNCKRYALDKEDYPYLSAYCPFCGAEMEVLND